MENIITARFQEHLQATSCVLGKIFYQENSKESCEKEQKWKLLVRKTMIHIEKILPLPTSSLHSLARKCLICVFWAVFLKNDCHILSQHLWMFLTAKFRIKWKPLNLGSKIPDFGVLRIKLDILIFEISAWNLSNSKILWKNKNGVKNLEQKMLF